jgi:hypothetical protein
MGKRINDIDAYIEEAVKNIRDDRNITSVLLTGVFAQIQNTNDSEAHKSLGFIASKYVETLQRSNEQLVKISSILSKKQEIGASLGEEDKKELFDIIQGDKK